MTRRRIAAFAAAAAMAAGLLPVVSAGVAAAAAVPTLVAPDDGAEVGSNPVLTWTRPDGASRFRVQVSAASDFSSTIDQADTFNIHYTPKVALPIGTLYWRVAAYQGTTAGAYTLPRSFHRTWTDAPQLIAPAHDAVLTYPDDPPLFRWEPLPGVKSYEIHIDDDENFIGATVATTLNTSYALPDQQTSGQAFYWRVIGKTANSINSAPSETRRYHIVWPEVPNPVTPVGNAVVSDVVLEWTPVKGAAAYQIVVSPNGDFSNNTIDTQVVKSTRYSPYPTYDNDTYYWKVRALDSDSPVNYGDWSAVAQFRRAWQEVPTPIAPDDGATFVSVPTLRWSAVPYASHYQVEISPDPNFTPGTQVACTTNQTSYTPYRLFTSAGVVALPVSDPCAFDDNDIQLGQPTYWRVKAVDMPAESVLKRISTEYSPVRSFIFKHDAIPWITGPADGAVVDTPTFTWTPVTGVAKYRVFLTYNGSPVSGYPLVTYGTTHTVVPSLVPEGVYTWTVATYDDQNRAGLIQDSRTFVHLPAADRGTTLSLLTPDDGATGITMPNMTWTPVQNATYYRLYYSLRGSGVKSEFVLSGQLVKPAHGGYTYSGPTLAPGLYDWWVEAYNSSNVKLATSDSRSFSTEHLAVTQNTAPEDCTETVACQVLRETPQLSWNAVPGAGGYLVYLANDASFTNVLRTYKTQYPSLTPREALPDSDSGEAYHWMAVPCLAVFPSPVRCGKFDATVFGTAFAFRKGSLPVQLTGPANGAVIPASGSEPAAITFSWADYMSTNSGATPPSGQGARVYQLVVSTTSDFSKVIDAVKTDQTTYTPWAKTYPEGPLYWKVQALDGGNQPLTWSETRLVTKSTPPLVIQNPTAGSIEPRAPFFRWSAQAHSAKYEVEVYRNADTSVSPTNKLSFTNASPKNSAFSPLYTLAAGEYFWRVRRVDAHTPTGYPGPWASGGTFHVRQAATTLLSPANGSTPTGGGLLFSWSAVPGASAYKFEASTSAAFTTLVESATTVMTSWAPVLSYPNQTIYWRVKVLDAENHEVSMSETRSVVIDTIVPTITSRPGNGLAVSGSFNVTFSEPVTGVSGATFVMKLANTATVIPLTFKVTNNVVNATLGRTLVPGEYYSFALSSGITDLRGNPLKPVAWQLRTSTVVDQRSPAVTEVWDRDLSKYAYGGGFFANNNAGTGLRFSFSGSSVAVVGRRARNGGYADVYIDGKKVNTSPVSFYASGDQWRVNVFAKSGLANTAHTLELRVLGSRPSVSAGTFAYVDGFRYGTRYVEETHAAVKGYFRGIGHSAAYGRSFDVENWAAVGDNGTKPFVDMRFRGTRVAWKAFKAPSYGTALIYVDNVYRGSVDLWASSSTTGPVTIWTSPTLTNAQHSVRIYVNGTRRAGATGYHVGWDSFAIS